MMHPRFSRVEKVWIAAFALCAFATRVVLIFRPRWEFSPVGDDAFYVFSIARNMARGLGPTVDVTHLTNGFQPLIALLYTPIFWICGTDSWLAVRWTFVLAGIVAALSVWTAAILIHELGPFKSSRASSSAHKETSVTPPVIGAFLWVFSIAIFMHTTNGLETGLYSLLLLWSMLAYARIRQREQASGDEQSGERVSIARWTGMGIILGFTILARIDAAILVVLVIVYEWLRSRPKPPIGPIVASLVAFVISSPWWLFNWLHFGSLMPTSGQAENLLPVDLNESLRRALQAVTDIALLIVYAPDAMGIAARGLLAISIAAAFWGINRKTNVLQKLRATRLCSLAPFAIFSCVLLLYYTFFFNAPHFIARFLEPMRILWLIVAAISIPIALNKLSTSWRIGMLGLIAVITLGFGTDRYVVNFFRIPGPSELYETGEWARAHPQENIGMMQSGIASFIAPNVINLDGKVNTEALHAAQNGRLGSYIQAEHFMYLADWKPFVEELAQICARNEVFYDSVGSIGRMTGTGNDSHVVQLMKLRTTR